MLVNTLKHILLLSCNSVHSIIGSFVDFWISVYDRTSSFFMANCQHVEENPGDLNYRANINTEGIGPKLQS